eukprot:1894967-Amphidinium_carterae.5
MHGSTHHDTTQPGSHFATNVGLQASTKASTKEIDNTMENILPTLTPETLTYVMQLDGDTEEIRRLNEMQDVDADMQSQIDEDHRREEDALSYEHRCHRLSEQTYTELIIPMDESVRAQEANARYERRQRQPDRARHQGSAQHLHQRYQALHQLLIAARRLRLEAQQRAARQEQQAANVINVQDGERVPKAAPPPGVPVPTSARQRTERTEMTIEQLREQVRREEDRVQAAKEGGYYISPPPPPTHYRDKE